MTSAKQEETTGTSTVLVANIKGGCGKTTISTHLAAALAKRGFKTALADADRQRSALGWVARRPFAAAPVRGLDWTDEAGDIPKGIERLVIDAGAGLRPKDLRVLVREADAIVVPVLPSAFDRTATGHFLQTLAEFKAIRKNRKPVALVRNRVKLLSLSARRLDLFIEGVEHRDLGRLPERALYDDLAEKGLALFDLDGGRAERLRGDWQPLLAYVDAR